jgi:hypothetical protein
MNAYKDGMIDFMQSHPEAFEELVALAVSEEGKLSWRAVWLLWSCMEPNDLRIRPFIPRFLEQLPGENESYQRDTLMVLQRMERTEEQDGILFDICTRIWMKVNSIPSVRYNAFRCMVSISRKFPELAGETIGLAEPKYVNSLSPGVRSSVRRILHEIS